MFSTFVNKNRSGYPELTVYQTSTLVDGLVNGLTRWVRLCWADYSCWSCEGGALCLGRLQVEWNIPI